MDKGPPLVPRNIYTQAVLKEQNAAPYDPKVHNSMINPYTHKRITCEAEYNAYIREYVYYRLCDEFLRARYADELARSREQFSEQLQQRARSHEAEIRQLRADHARTLTKRRFLWASAALVLVLVLAACLLGYMPHRIDAAYTAGTGDGYSSGYDAGMDDGYASGKSDGYSDGYFDGVSDGVSSSTSSSYTAPRSSIDATTTVYVSRSGHLIHRRSNCSNMKYYTEMTYAEACAAGYRHCSKCF